MFKVATGILAALALTLAVSTTYVLAQEAPARGGRGQHMSAPAQSGAPQMRGPGYGRGQGQMAGPRPMPPVNRPGYGPRPGYGRPLPPPPAYGHMHYPRYWGEYPTPSIYYYGGYPAYPYAPLYPYPGFALNGWMGYGPLSLNFSWFKSDDGKDANDEAANVGKVKFAIEPKSAVVLIDGAYVGEVRDLGKGLKLEAGAHNITIVVGEQQKEFKVDILPGQTITIRATK